MPAYAGMTLPREWGFSLGRWHHTFAIARRWIPAFAGMTIWERPALFTGPLVFTRLNALPSAAA